MRVLVVEDEKRLAEALKEILKEERYIVDVVNDGENGYDYAKSQIYDAIILDIMLPKMNGLDVVRRLRREHISTPVLLLTARETVGDRVEGLDAGADDYLTKPFAPQELLARLRAMTRRHGEVILDEMSYGDLTLRLDAYQLCRKERSVRLSIREFEIMRLLMSNPRMVLPKEEILLKVWGAESKAEDNNVEVYISFLRKKLFYLGSSVGTAIIRKDGY